MPLKPDEQIYMQANQSNIPMAQIKSTIKRMLLFMACASFVFISGCAHPQNNNSDRQVIDTLKKFYIDYNTVWDTVDNGNTLQKKIYILRKKYCTPELLKVMGDDLDHDLLTNDFGTDMEYLKTITVRKDSTKSDTYIVSYIAHGYYSPNKKNEFKIPQTTYLKVLNEKGVIKIDSVWSKE